MEERQLISYGKIRLDNGRYEGQFLNGTPEGKGTFFYNESGLQGWIYTGEFKNGVPDGNGSQTDDKKIARYSGGWSAGKKHGEGRGIHLSK
jgi:hypothetical protein